MNYTIHRPIAAAVAVLALLGGVAACGDDDSAATPSTSARSETTTTTESSAAPPTTNAAPTTPPTTPRSTNAPTTTAAAAVSAAPASASLQAGLDALVAAGVPGAAVLSRHGDHVEIGVAGVADRATGEPVTADTVFRTGSVAKTFVATVMLQLSAEGVVSLDDTVEHWLPGLVPGGDGISVRQLLGNRSGLFDFVEDPQVLAPYLAGELGHVWTSEQLVAVSNAHAPNFAPGTAALYSNTDYTLAGMIIERATSRTVADEVATRITGPLGLDHTTIPATGELAAPFAHGYALDAGMQDVTALSPSLSSFGGNLVSTVGDLSGFFDALFGGRLLPPELLAEMRTTSVSQVGEVLGLGLQVVELPCGSLVGHSGSTPGYKAAAFNGVADDTQFILLVNSLTQQDQVGDEAANAAFDQLAAIAACP
jgi:D-alanyl-D-alanine carboxypeptidase